MNAMYLAIPVVGGIALYLITSAKSKVSSAIAPPPGTPTAVSGGPRYHSYMQQLQAAGVAYDAASLFDRSSTSAAAQQFKGTLDVVGQMAQADMQAGNITGADLGAIQSAISALKKKLG